MLPLELECKDDSGQLVGGPIPGLEHRLDAAFPACEVSLPPVDDFAFVEPAGKQELAAVADIVAKGGGFVLLGGRKHPDHERVLFKRENWFLIHDGLRVLITGHVSGRPMGRLAWAGT